MLAIDKIEALFGVAMNDGAEEEETALCRP